MYHFNLRDKSGFEQIAADIHEMLPEDRDAADLLALWDRKADTL